MTACVATLTGGEGWLHDYPYLVGVATWAPQVCRGGRVATLSSDEGCHTVTLFFLKKKILT